MNATRLTGLVILGLLGASPLLADATAVLAGIGRDRELLQEERTELRFRTHEPRGLALAAHRWFLAAYEADGGGQGHLFVADRAGALVRDLPLGDGAATRPGGISSDGDQVWIPVATTREGAGHTLVYTVDVRTLRVRRRFHVDRVLDALAVDPATRTLHAWTAGGRDQLILTQGGRVVENRPDPNRVFATTDAQVLPGGRILAAGSSTHAVRVGLGVEDLVLGGITLQDRRGEIRMIHLVREVSDRFRPMAAAAMAVEPVGDSVRLHFAPDPERTTIYSFAPGRASRVSLGTPEHPPGRQ